MDFMSHPTFEDHTRERALEESQAVYTNIGEEDPRGTGRIKPAPLFDSYSDETPQRISVDAKKLVSLYRDASCIALLVKAIRANTIQLLPRTGTAGDYQAIVELLAAKAKEMDA